MDPQSGGIIKRLNQLITDWTPTRASQLTTAYNNSQSLVARITDTFITRFNSMYSWLSSLYTNLTTVRIAKLDNLDMAISAIAAAKDMRVRHGSFSFLAGESVIDITVGGIYDVDKSVVWAESYQLTISGSVISKVAGYMVDTTTLRLGRGLTGAVVNGRYHVLFWE